MIFKNRNPLNQGICLAVLVGLAVAIGLFIRISSLDARMCWHDEALSLLCLSGHSESKIYEEFFNRSILSPDDLKKLINPDEQSNLFALLNTLIKDRPLETPLYFVCAYFLTPFMAPLLAARIVALICGIALIPAIWLLCRESFGSRLAAWISLVLVSLSPFAYLYSQEARPFSMWALLTALYSYFVLKALKNQKTSTWMLAGLIMTAAAYTQLLTIPCLLGQLWFVVSIRSKESTIGMLKACSMAVGAVLPWLIWQWTERKEHFLEPLQLAANYDPPAFMLIKLLGNFSSVFFDIPFSLKSYGVVIFALVVGLAIFAYGYTALKAENKSGLLMLCTGLAPIVVLITSDLIWGSYRFGTVRYWTPLVIGLWLAMGYFFARQIGSESKVKSRLWSLALAVLVGIEIFSSLASMNTLEWWTKRQRDINLPLIASALNTSPNALLVVSDAHQENLGTALALSRLLKPDVRVEFVRANRIPDLPGVYQNIFFLDNSTTYVKNVGRAMHFDLLGSDKTAAFYKAVVVVRR